MTAIERTAYPRFKRTSNTKELTTVYTPTPQEIQLAQSQVRGAVPLLSFLVLLKAFQRLGYFPPLQDVPTAIINYIRSVLKLNPDVLPFLTPTTVYKYHKVIRRHCKVMVYDQQAQQVLTNILTQAAQVMDTPADLVNVAVEELIHRCYELPAFSTLDRLVRQIRTQVNQQFFQAVFNRLSNKEVERLNRFLDADPQRRRRQYDKLKQLPKRPSRNHLRDLICHLDWLLALGDVAPHLAGIPMTKLRHFIAESKALDASELKDITLPKRLTLILCLIRHAQVQTRDNLAEMFVKRMQKLKNLAREELENLRLKHHLTTEKLITVLSGVLQVFIDEPPDQEAGRLTKELFRPQGGVQQLLEECETAAACNSDNYLPLMWKFFKSYRSSCCQILDQLQLESTSQDQTLIKAIAFLSDNSHRRGEKLPATVDLTFASEPWQKLVLSQQDKPSWMNRRHFEVCVFFHLAEELKSGDICVKHSEAYADYRNQLQPWKECQSMLTVYCQEQGLPQTAQGFVKQLKSLLSEIAQQVDQGYPDNDQLEVDPVGELTLKRSPQRASSSVEDLEELLYQRLPIRNLIDILRNVEAWTNFTRHFGPVSGSEPKLERPTERYVLSTFTYGCNLGSTQAARHLRGAVTPRMLMYVNQRHIDTEKLEAALCDLINAYHTFNLPKLWGDGTSAAADGTKYDLYEQNLISEYHIRYGGYGGIAYHHVADNYVALFSHFITCGTWEGIYILEGLQKNKSEVQPDTVHSDPHGQSLPGFALASLLGIKLMPRIRNFKDLIFYRPDQETTYKHIDKIFQGILNWQIIETHWQDLMQVALSIKAGKLSSAVLLRKLTHDSRKNQLYKAFRELGKVIRTIFLLQYISDKELRVKITATMNQVENYHKFAGWFFFGGEGVITENDPLDQEKAIKYNDVVANAVILHNIIDMTTTLKYLLDEGYSVSRPEVTQLSPYLTRNVKRFGDYIMDAEVMPMPLDEELMFPEQPKQVST